MSKKLFISEKPSVAQEFAKALKITGSKANGYIESEDAIITWCVGHLVTMSYPEAYEPSLKKWSLSTLPFCPEHFLYEVIPSVSKQFQVVKGLLNRKDVSIIYVCTDSGREGEYIYRLVEQMANVPKDKEKRRVWIDSQTEEEILRGIGEARLLSEYDNLSASAYLRAKEDYLMGINFSRVLTLKYGQAVTSFLNQKWTAISVGRVMTCVLGMVVRREREIRSFVKTPFYRIIGQFELDGQSFEGEWRAVEGSRYFNSPLLYKENGFKERADAEKLVEELGHNSPLNGAVEKVEKKKEKKNPPLLFNLAELQNECAKLFKISPDETLKYTQELYEKKLVTYPRTDARVLSTAVSKEIQKNIKGLSNIPGIKAFVEEILQKEKYRGIEKTRYVNDKQITDHYAIIPTGQGFHNLRSMSQTAVRLYEVICRRFLSIFFPPAEYQKISIVSKVQTEVFFTSIRLLVSPGYLQVMEYSFKKKEEEAAENEGESQETVNAALVEAVAHLKKGHPLTVASLTIKEGETSPPKRYNSGSMILAMENAGQLIEDEELRSQIKGSGIGTSATRAEILNKLVKIEYLRLNKKTQIITPTLQGELIYDVVNSSIRSLLNPELTASWEKGLTYVAEGSISEDEYMKKLESFVTKMVNGVKNLNNQSQLNQFFELAAQNYKN
ncbi:DNA topoisomerase [Anaeromicropila populeti]|uniref:DNA topoisomerase n=1 Tax=Anaeromicropila populeti TaxID=37658 RepID=A0A1I6HPA2_9FIRM|nr:DNA topoisomerase [Anaeromicropila populeti]SFR56283.1 DNA topoisomerase-3 [Anaeromicropila populeti]